MYDFFELALTIGAVLVIAIAFIGFVALVVEGLLFD